MKAMMDTIVEVKKRERSRRRRWSEALKRQIVTETLEPGASVSLVARRHDVNANLLFNWRRQHQGGMLTPAADSTAMVPVRVERPARKKRQSAAETARRGGGTIEIELPDGIRVRVSGAVDGGTLRQVLGMLARP
jgi:transposase